MLRTSLIEIVNKGHAWAFVGSGVSASAGLPSWLDLTKLVRAEMELAHEKLTAKETSRFERAVTEYRYPDAFEVLKEKYRSGEVDEFVEKTYDIDIKPTELDVELARWPFAAYVTTNYDLLLEKALSHHGGWVSVGNTATENQKVSGDVTNIVWHPHGAVDLGEKSARFVIAKSDYDEIYPGGSPTASALEAVTRMSRLVFFGFGFKDPDLMILFERLARLRDPTRLAYAFLADCPESEAHKYWEKYAVDVISYSTNRGDHSQLNELVKTYGSFVMTRDLGFRADMISTPGHDPEVSSLLTHNALMHKDWEPSIVGQQTILRSRILALLATRGTMGSDAIASEVALTAGRMTSSVPAALKKLETEKYVRQIGAGWEVTDLAKDAASNGKAKAEIARDKFMASLESRASADVAEVSNVAAAYVEDACRKRGAAIAQQLVQSDEQMVFARTVALLQGLHDDLSRCSSRENAMAVVRLLWQVLSSPTDAEREYLGLLTQAYFARQLVGLDPTSAEVRLSVLEETVLIVDSSLLIPLLAQGSSGDQYATRLVQLAGER